MIPASTATGTRNRPVPRWAHASAQPKPATAIQNRIRSGSGSGNGLSSATPTAGKEWIEIHTGARRMVIDDFRSCAVDGKRLWRGGQDKGHAALARAFRQAVAGGADLPTEDLLASMRVTIRAAAQREWHE